MTQVNVGSTPKYGSNHKSTLVRKVLLGFAGVALLFVVLDLGGRLAGLSESTMPRAWSIIQRLFELPFEASFVSALLETLFAALIGLLIAIAIAVPVGVLLGTSMPTFRAVSALIEFLRPIPPVALIPPVLLIMGAGEEMKIFMVVFGTFWILLFNTIYAIRGVESGLKDAGRVFGTGRFKSLVVISLPAAAPFIYTGIQIAVTAALIVTIGVEMIAGGSGGIGYWLMDNLSGGGNRDWVFAGAFGAGLVGLAVTAATIYLGRFFFPWSVGQRKAES